MERDIEKALKIAGRQAKSQVRFNLAYLFLSSTFPLFHTTSVDSKSHLDVFYTELFCIITSLAINSSII